MWPRRLRHELPAPRARQAVAALRASVHGHGCLHVALAWALMAGTLAGCGGPAPTTSTTPKQVDDPAPAPRKDHHPPPVAQAAPRFLHVVEPPGKEPDRSPGAVLAARVFAFSDSQFHYLFGKRTFAQSPFAESMSFEVAVRPAALDESSDLLLGVFLDEYRAHYQEHSLVFLGDAADLSCVQEIEAFTRVLASRGIHELLGVTSNHDGFYAGNFTSRRDLDGNLALTDMPDDWTRACSEPGRFTDQRLTKGRAVKRFYDLLPHAEPWATFAVWLGDGPTDFRQSQLYYVRRLQGGEPGAPPVWGVFLDTVDYRGFDFERSRGAGSAGAVSRDQLRFLDRAMFEARVASEKGPVTYVLFGHHPFRDLEPGSRELVRRFLDAHPEIAVYVSAHAHQSMERSIDLATGRRVPELVVGSTTDAPQSGRTIDIWVEPDKGRRVATTRRLVLDTDALCKGITPMAEDTLGYTGYRILRNGTPELDIGSLEKLLFAVGLDDLGSHRLVQAVGALLMENELVRAWAKLYQDAPIGQDARDRGILDRILASRYAAGNDVAALRPFLRGERRAGDAVSEYASWHDPVMARVLAVAELGVHRFGAHVQEFERLRGLRTSSHATRQYFVCHAAFAAAAEARTPRQQGNILYIR